MKLVLYSFKSGYKAFMGYKHNFLTYWINNLMSIVLIYFLWSAISKNNNSIDLNQQIVYLIFSQILISIMPEVMYEYNDLVQTGDIAYEMLLPVNFEWIMLFKSFGFSMAKLLIILPLDLTVMYIFFQNEIFVSQVVLLFALLPLTFVLGFTIELCFSSVTLFTYSVWGVNTIKSAILLVLSGAYFPLSLLPNTFKQVIQILPFSYVYGGLTSIITKPNLHDILMFILIQLVWVVILLKLYKTISNKGLQKFIIQGG